MLIAKSVNKDVFELGEKIFKLFNNTGEKLEDALESQYSLHYSIYPISSFPDPNNTYWPIVYHGTSHLTTLANGIREIVPQGIMSKNKPSGKILLCDEDVKCDIDEKIVQDTVFCKNKQIKNSYDFTYQLEIIQNSGNIEKVNEMIEKYKNIAMSISEQENVIFNDNLNKLVDQVSQIDINTFKYLNPDIQSFNTYIENLNILASIIQRYQEINLHYSTLRFIESIYKFDSIDPNETFQSIVSYITQWLNDVKNIYNIVQSVDYDTDLPILQFKKYKVLLDIKIDDK
jgi:hypothetical protein